MAATTSLLARAATAISDRSSLPIRAAAAATVAVGTLFGAHVASGQQLVDNAPSSALGATAKQPAPLVTPNRLPASICSDAIKIGDAIIRRYEGRVSPQFIDSFVAFGRSACDLSIVFVRVDGTADEQAFGEYRVRLIALKMDAASKSSRLTQ
jgi:hypothetical protein